MIVCLFMVSTVTVLECECMIVVECGILECGNVGTWAYVYNL